MARRSSSARPPSGGTGIILEEFNTLATTQTYYVEYDANYNVTSLSNSSGGVIERYAYDPYGNVTVESATGATLGNGSAAGTLYGWVYLHQGLRLDVLTGLDDDRMRQTYNPALGRFEQEDPAAYVNGSNRFASYSSNPMGYTDPIGFSVVVITVTRTTDTGTSTVGTVNVGVQGDPTPGPTGYTLEPPHAPDPNGNGKVCVPPGTYKAHYRQSAKGAKVGGKVLELEGVPGKSNIEIHPGNTADNTDGCILPGTDKGDDQVTNSVKEVKAINQYIQNIRDKDATNGQTTTVIVKIVDPIATTQPTQH